MPRADRAAAPATTSRNRLRGDTVELRRDTAAAWRRGPLPLVRAEDRQTRRRLLEMALGNA